ncbi:MAG TPA: UDP-N-acetylmuramoyl-L-alanine--D-glutamate ligase [Baekduia sp.]|uniref:UDP-N-acetylmuramoyl-L-alanine--D-glutamate ligase n=1 Tax=Baekduia sp. TaxID=2600305 RepID=UPI002D79AD81|nr:UDP-N-acetylmuramoyl-L-alanine--D-glutamate ligase [Baekduia sp.]HET6505549.1 UDP-N-acetylmuramoyl-L-alanine--D-glutamate ligase [Baekduia sp.]
MSPRPPLPPGPYLIVGLARSGRAAAALLHARGHEVLALDGAPRERLKGLDELPPPVEVHAGTDGVALLERVRAVVKSPGVPQTAPVVAAARERGLPVFGELELAWRCVPNEVIAVTGTNGKTTTTELLGHLHRTAGVPVDVVGNVGTAYASLALAERDERAVVVCECSSFQLEDTISFAPECAVLLNLESDHLDRHGSIEAYHQAKLKVFAHQGNDDVAVAPEGLGVVDLGGCARRVCVGDSPEAELSLRADTLWWDSEPLLRVEELALRGPHNVRNAMAAAAAALARGLPIDAVRQGLTTFAGVPHRLEEVARRDGITYVNDSKATNVAAALVGLASFEQPVHAILGGIGKGEDYRPLRPAVQRHCRAVYLIGEEAGAIRSALDGLEGIPLHDSGDLATAVRSARADARPGDVVLLSPACASYDQFENFEVRGEAFREAART